MKTIATDNTSFVSLQSSLAESPENWNLEFQQDEIFVDNFLVIDNNLNIVAETFIYLQANFTKMLIFKQYLHSL